MSDKTETKIDYLELAKHELNKGFYESSNTAALIAIADSLAQIADAVIENRIDELARHGAKITHI